MSSEFFNDTEAVKKNFQAIADLKSRIGELTDDLRKKEAIALAFINHKEKETGDKVTIELEFGKFIAMRRVTYTYSSNVKTCEEQVKALKKAEEEQGVAKVKTNTAFIKFTPNKE